MLGLFKEPEVPVERELALKRVREILTSHLNKGYICDWESVFQELPTLTSAEDMEEVKSYFTKLTSWDFLEKVLDDKATEFFFHSPTHSQALLRDGTKLTLTLPLTDEDWQLWLEIISIHFQQNWNVKQPFISFYGSVYERKFRFSLIHSSTSPLGISKLILRSLSSTPHPLSSFGHSQSLPRLIQTKKNLLIAGSTGSGKTSLLTTLLEEVEEHEHVVILEDTYEILTSLPYQTRFLSGDTLETSLKAYLSYSLRLSPDRIILGEMRSHEVVSFLLAMNTGHRGLMGTVHASSAVDALNRVALLFSLYAADASLDFEKIMELICRNLEYVVFMEKKKVKEVIKILGSDQGVPFFESVENENPAEAGLLI